MPKVAKCAWWRGGTGYQKACRIFGDRRARRAAVAAGALEDATFVPVNVIEECDGRRQFKVSGEMMAKIAVTHLAERLRLVVMQDRKSVV